MEKIIHISQPRIYPHITYLDKVSKSDLFIVSDDLENQKGKFELRNKFLEKLSQSPKYLNVPIEKKDRFRDLIISDLSYYKKHRDVLYYSYKDYPFFDKSILEQLIPEPKSKWYIEQWENTFINITKMLDISINFDYATKVQSTKHKVERLEEIVGYYQGTKYLSGIAGEDYIKEMKYPFVIHSTEDSKFEYRESDNNYYMIADTIFLKGIKEVKNILKSK